MLPDLKTVVLVAAFLAGVACAQVVQVLHINALKAEHERYAAQVERNAAQAERDAALLNLKWQKEKQDAQTEAKARLAEVETERTHLAESAERLRGDLAAVRARLADASPAACVDAGNSFAELFGRCVNEYRAVALAASLHAGDLATCRDAWPGVAP
jgi:Tfp pilus assembly protein PilE